MESDSLIVKEYFIVLFKYKIMIITITLLTMLITFFYQRQLPPIYQASSSFFISSPTQSGSQFFSSLGIGSANGSSISIPLIIEMIESKRIQNIMVNELNLKKHYKLSTIQQARLTLKGNTSTSIKKSGIIKLSVTDKHPETSKRITDAYLQNIKKLNKELEIVSQREFIRILDTAETPTQRIGPRVMFKTLLISLSSFIFSIVLAFVLNFLSKTNDD